jgi:hypothetical protein
MNKFLRKKNKKKREINRKNDRKKKIDNLNYLNNLKEISIVNNNKNIDIVDNKVISFILKKYWIQFKNGIKKLRLHLNIFKNRIIYIEKENPEYGISETRTVGYQSKKYPMRDSHRRIIGGGCFMRGFPANKFIVACDGLHAHCDYESHNVKYNSWKKDKLKFTSIYSFTCNPETQYECSAAFYYRGILNYHSCFEAGLKSGVFQEHETYDGWLNLNNNRTLNKIKEMYAHLCDNEGFNDFCKYDCCCEESHVKYYQLRCPHEFAYKIQRYWKRFSMKKKRMIMYGKIRDKLFEKGLFEDIWTYMKKFIY